MKAITINHFTSSPALKINENTIFDRQRISQELQHLKLNDYKPYLSYFITDGYYRDTAIYAKIKLSDQAIESLVVENQRVQRRYRIDLSYDGSNYQGFQKQPHKQTVQDTLENCLKHLCQEPIQTHPASRTDAKVHAYHQVVHFDTCSPLKADKLMEQLEFMLPKDIKILNIETVPQLFHARYDTLKKTYHYYLSKQANPFLANYAVFVADFDVEKASSMLKTIEGEHDFKWFSKASNKNNTTRFIHKAKIIEEETKLIIEITGEGFLRHMVRMIVGHLFYELKTNQGSFYKALNEPNTTHKKYLAPPQALYLKAIDYV